MIDAAVAVEFAARFGPPCVMAFASGRCLHPSLPTSAAARDFIEANADADLYFAPAALRDAFVGKPRKTDCVGSDWVWVDIDPPKGLTNPAALTEWRDAALARADAADCPPPTTVVYSGRGLWLFWHLAHRVTPAETEAINHALANMLGADACHNIDRVARLPGTRNSKTGAIAVVLRELPGAVSPEALPRLAPVDAGEDIDLGDLGTPTPIATEDDFREIVAALDCPEVKRNDLLLAALCPERVNDFRDKPLDVRDRSAVMFSWAMKAIAAGMAPATVRDCILSPAVPAISAHLLDPSKPSSSLRERAAARQVARAVQKAAELGLSSPFAVQEAVAEAEAAANAVGLISLAPIPADLPARPWLAENLLMDGQVTMLTGRGGEGKSLLALQLGVMVAAGVEFAWWHPRQRRNVLILNAEDNLDEQRRRLAGACQVMGVDPRLLEGKLFSLDSERLTLVQRDPDGGEIKTTELYDRLLALIADNNIGLLVIDPLVEAHVNLDENSNVDMKELLVLLRKMARRREMPLLIVHHSRKGASGGDQDGARGGSALVNACRVVVTIDRMSDDEHGKINPPQLKERYVRVTGAKANYAGRIGDRWLELDPVQLPSGDETPGFRRVVFGKVDEGFDVRTWEHGDELLRLVGDGRGGGRLWSTAVSGPKTARLDALIAGRFGLDTKQAKDVLDRFAAAGLIHRAEQKDNDRKTVSVWALPHSELPEGTQEIPF